VIVLSGGVCASCAFAQPEASRLSPADPSPAAQGEVLVKVTPQTSQAIEAARAAGTFPTTGIDSLDALFTRYAVTAIERVFPKEATDAEAIKAKYPERSQRIPPGAEVPDLGRTYKLTLNPTPNLQEVIAAFASDPHVESAQPNYIATVQPHEEIP